MTLEDYSKIAIGTTTFYKKGMPNGELRAGLAEKVIKTAVDSGYKMIVVDGSPEEWFPRSIEGSGAIIHRETPGGGMGGSRRECIQYAHDLGTPVVAWMEPEKLDYVKEVIKTAQPILDGVADLVVPDRRIDSPFGPQLPSYPTSQQHEEAFGNDYWRELTGTDLDVWCGSRTWARNLSKHFLKYDGKKHFHEVDGKQIPYGDRWDSIFIPVMQAILDGKRVIGIKVDYTHPAEQTALEEGNYKDTEKRRFQLNNLAPALIHYWETNYPTSKLREMREAA